jgi:hypothetical protein
MEEFRTQNMETVEQKTSNAPTYNMVNKKWFIFVMATCLIPIVLLIIVGLIHPGLEFYQMDGHRYLLSDLIYSKKIAGVIGLIGLILTIVAVAIAFLSGLISLLSNENSSFVTDAHKGRRMLEMYWRISLFGFVFLCFLPFFFGSYAFTAEAVVYGLVCLFIPVLYMQDFGSKSSIIKKWAYCCTKNQEKIIARYEKHSRRRNRRSK